MFLLAGTCAEERPAEDLAPAPAAPVAGLEVAEVRGAVIEFLRTYASTAADVSRLEELVDGPDLERWVHWLGVQNAGLPFERPGEVQLRALRVAEIGGSTAAVAVDATVNIYLRDRRGQVVVSPRVFESPFFLTRREDGSWAVVDASRDGRSMRAAIALLEPQARATAGGVTVTIDSVFRFSPATAVNVTVRNSTGGRLVVDLSRSFLQVGELPLQGAGITSSLAEPIPAGAQVEGALNFAPIPLTQPPQAFALRLVGERRMTLTVELPQTAFALGP
jgi:hypothetical protein